MRGLVFKPNLVEEVDAARACKELAETFPDATEHPMSDDHPSAVPSYSTRSHLSWNVS